METLYLQAKRVLGICGGAIISLIIILIKRMMNQIHIGVVVPVMENGRIHTFQVQYTMTTQKMCSDQDMNVIVRESEGKHILHTVLYSENV